MIDYTKVDHFIRPIRDYAECEYDTGQGWDYVVESYSDLDILEIIGGAGNFDEALELVRLDVLSRVQYAAEIQAEIF